MLAVSCEGGGDGAAIAARQNVHSLAHTQAQFHYMNQWSKSLGANLADGTFEYAQCSRPTIWQRTKMLFRQAAPATSVPRRSEAGAPFREISSIGIFCRCRSSQSDLQVIRLRERNSLKFKFQHYPIPLPSEPHRLPLGRGRVRSQTRSRELCSSLQVRSITSTSLRRKKLVR